MTVLVTAVNGLVKDCNKLLFKFCIIIVIIVVHLLIKERDLSGSNFKIKTTPVTLT